MIRRTPPRALRRLAAVLFLLAPLALADGLPPRWTAFHAPPLGPALQVLADHRRGQGYEVSLIEVAPGTPAALSTKIEELKRSPRAGDVLLFAGALDDRSGARADCLLAAGTGTQGRMSGKPSDSILGLDAKTGIPGLVAGRLPAGSPEELQVMVSKILAFESNPAPADRHLSYLLGNPMPGVETSWFADFFLTIQSRMMLARVHPVWQTSGAADVRSHPLAKTGAAFRRGVEETTASDYEVLAFFGHSAPEGIASHGELYLRPADWARVTPGGARGIFLTCGCWAMAAQSAYAVQAVRSPAGPVAAIGASGESYSTFGYLAGLALANCTSGPEGPATIGEWWMQVQQAIHHSPVSSLTFFLFDRIDGTGGRRTLADQRREHLEMWLLLGDPATRMPRTR